MDSPVSAFAVYRANKSTNKSKRNKRKNKAKNAKHLLKTNTVVSNELHKEIAQKLKKNLQKEPKKLNKKKSLKKKINKENKTSFAEKNMPKKNTVSSSDNEDTLPVLITTPLHSENGTLSPYKTTDLDDGCDSVSVNASDGSIEFIPVQTDSVEEGLKVFKWMLAPYNTDNFFNRVWEKKPLHIVRNKPNYYKELLTTPIIDDMLRKENIQFTKNIDITSYIGGKRETHNPEGRAHPHLVWDYYLNGCSIRLLNPQTYIPKLHLLNATLQEFFNSFVGANAYLTPPDSQGFAPHYDDIEAFILQTEGKKHWKIYKPLNDNEVLPRVSSKNYDQEEIGEPMMEVTLEAGDILYFPRGFIHQGVTVDGEHSLHVTISMYQKHSWADLFEKMLPAALQMTITENVEFRCGLPFDIYDNFGLVYSDLTTPRRKQLEDVIKTLFDRIKNHLPMDEAVDQMNKNYQHDALPPMLSDLEKAVTVFGDSDVMIENGKVTNRVEISLDTRVRLLRKNILRMVSEEKIRLYYYIENSLEYHGSELPYFEIEEDLAPAVDTLVVSYPEYVAVESLDAPNDSDKLQLADALWSRGLIMTEYPLENIDDE